jgi:hypothetical protein
VTVEFAIHIEDGGSLRKAWKLLQIELRGPGRVLRVHDHPRDADPHQEEKENKGSPASDAKKNAERTLHVIMQSMDRART